MSPSLSLPVWNKPVWNWSQQNAGVLDTGKPVAGLMLRVIRPVCGLEVVLKVLLLLLRGANAELTACGHHLQKLWLNLLPS